MLTFTPLWSDELLLLLCSSAGKPQNIKSTKATWCQFIKQQPMRRLRSSTLSLDSQSHHNECRTFSFQSLVAADELQLLFKHHLTHIQVSLNLMQTAHTHTLLTEAHTWIQTQLRVNANIWRRISVSRREHYS